MSVPEEALSENKPSDTEELLQKPFLISSHGIKKWQKWKQAEDVARDTCCLEFSNVRMILRDNRQNSEQLCALFFTKLSLQTDVLYKAPCWLWISRMWLEDSFHLRIFKKLLLCDGEINL